MKIRTIPPLGLRIEPELKQMLKDIAKKEGRSLNSELVQRLKRTLREDGLINV
ncbi:Arc family DNA-binding protein [Xenorhabdus sp. XENO-10]|uniref:Arc family DNA-binding protein n=1 Tax=Xenorhabdus yunnanensis TaxID=3025878 RepID=A0ABT5LIV2_9GAMM|nr:Arc family DNA-binding protein [Xenorhabdus yunnanensis]MDC9591032.1 Arc family DNA-binding protein [Xenorhabdus yunnanensis]